MQEKEPAVFLIKKIKMTFSITKDFYDYTLWCFSFKKVKAEQSGHSSLYPCQLQFPTSFSATLNDLISFAKLVLWLPEASHLRGLISRCDIQNNGLTSAPLWHHLACGQRQRCDYLFKLSGGRGKAWESLAARDFFHFFKGDIFKWSRTKPVNLPEQHGTDMSPKYNSGWFTTRNRWVTGS